MSEPWHECRCPRCNACPDCTDVEDRPVADAARKQAEEALTKFEQSPGTYDFYTSAWRVAECLRSLLAATPEPAPAMPEEVREAAERADKAMRDVFGGVDKYGDYCGHPLIPAKLAHAVQDLLVALDAAARGEKPCPSCGRTGKGCACTVEERESARGEK